MKKAGEPRKAPAPCGCGSVKERVPPAVKAHRDLHAAPTVKATERLRAAGFGADRRTKPLARPASRATLTGTGDGVQGWLCLHRTSTLHVSNALCVGLVKLDRSDAAGFTRNFSQAEGDLSAFAPTCSARSWALNFSVPCRACLRDRRTGSPPSGGGC